MLLIDALNIKSGGGTTLLKYLIKKLEKEGREFRVLLDLEADVGCDETKIIRLRFNKFNKKRSLKKILNSDNYSVLLCFGNFPPPFQFLDGQVYTFLQSMYIADRHIKLTNYPWLVRLYTRLSNLYFAIYLRYTDFVIVQGYHVLQRLLCSYSIKSNRCLILPFYPSSGRTNKVFKKYEEFVYISTGERHKNHFNLFKAWEYLSDTPYIRTLHVTIDSKLFKTLLQQFPRAKNIINHGFINRKSVSDLLERSYYCIYPSTLETIGLGLIESVEFGCKVIASDLPFVHEVLEPSLTFNPYDYLSIANSVRIALTNDIQDSKILLNDNIDELIDLLFKGEV